MIQVCNWNVLCLQRIHFPKVYLLYIVIEISIDITEKLFMDYLSLTARYCFSFKKKTVVLDILFKTRLQIFHELLSSPADNNNFFEKNASFQPKFKLLNLSQTWLRIYKLTWKFHIWMFLLFDLSITCGRAWKPLVSHGEHFSDTYLLCIRGVLLKNEWE